jgi:hypothetical protein
MEKKDKYHHERRRRLGTVMKEEVGENMKVKIAEAIIEDIVLVVSMITVFILLTKVLDMLLYLDETSKCMLHIGLGLTVAIIAIVTRRAFLKFIKNYLKERNFRIAKYL